MSIWTNIKLWIANALGFIFANPLVLVPVAAAIAALLVFSQVQSCRRESWNKKAEKTREEILTDKIEANAIANQKTNLQIEANNAKKNTNQALSNFNAALNRDSNSFSGANSDERFCRRYPSDSSCAEWRRMRGMQ